jgi:hypothetical protein
MADAESSNQEKTNDLESERNHLFLFWNWISKLNVSLSLSSGDSYLEQEKQA